MTNFFDDEPTFEILMLGYFDSKSYFGKSNLPMDIFQLILGEVLSLNSIYLKIKIDEKVDVSTFTLSTNLLEAFNGFRGDAFELSCFNCQLGSPKTYLIALGDESVQKNTIVISRNLADSMKSRMNTTQLFAVRVQLFCDINYGKKLYLEYHSDDNEKKFDSHLLPFFKDTYRTACVGDCFLIDGISFRVAASEPNPCIVSPETIIYEGLI